MYITLESDYAVRITAELCRTQDKLDAKTISERTNVTLRFSLKILRKLVAAGIVKSFKGTQGGYKIAREPSEITLKSVIEAIEIDKKCYIKLLCLLVVFIIVPFESLTSLPSILYTTLPAVAGIAVFDPLICTVNFNLSLFFVTPLIFIIDVWFFTFKVLLN